MQNRKEMECRERECRQGEKISVASAVSGLKEEVLGDKEYAKLFIKKIQEERGRLVGLRMVCDMLAQAIAIANENDRLIAEYWLEKKQKQRQDCEQRIRTFTWYKQVCQKKISKTTLHIEEAKQVLISAVLPSNPAQKFGDRWKYLCPLHSEKTPSFVYFVRQNRWQCFGCSQGGDVIDLVQKLHGLSLKDAVRQLTY